MRNIYAEKAISQIPRLLSLEDRNPLSKTYGCFDRTYWLDKAIDFPSAIYQFAVHSLALVYTHKFPKNIYFKNEKIKNWCLAGIDFWTKIQKNDGSYDEFYPNERGWAGPTGFLLYAMMESYKLLKSEFPKDLREKFFRAAKKSAKYLIKYDEHGILANHHAVAMLAVYSAYDILKEDWILEGYTKKFEFFKKLNYPEGWSLEYDGVDMGYLSATVSFLGKIYKMNPDPAILNLAKKSIDFTSYFVYPNKFYAGTIGSRQTSHFYPHGYEIFSRQIPLAGKIADKMLEGLEEGRLVPPEIMPDRYLAYRVPEFLLAYLDYKPRKSKITDLPHERKPFQKYFTQAGIFIKRDKDYYMIVNLNKGGIIKVFDVRSKKLVHNDCGILGRLKGRKLVTSQWVDKDYKKEVKEDKVIISGHLHQVPEKMPTPFKMILFRTALLSLGRNTRMAYKLKGIIRKMMITKSKRVPIKFERKISFKDKISVEDKIIILKNDKFESLMIGDEFSVRYVPQSLYFQNQELDVKGFNVHNDYLNNLNKKREIILNRKI